MLQNCVWTQKKKIMKIIKCFNKVVLAQLVERMAFNHVVVGSIPIDGGNLIF